MILSNLLIDVKNGARERNGEVIERVMREIWQVAWPGVALVGPIDRWLDDGGHCYGFIRARTGWELED